MMNFQKSTEENEEVLVRNATKSDLGAFNQLVLIYQNKVYNHAYALLGDHASAEDATQECFLKAFQNIGRFRGGSFQGWLLKIVTNSAYDLLRRTGRHPTQPLIPLDENGEEVETPAWTSDPGPSVQEVVEQHEEAAELEKILHQLPLAYRSVITLVDLDELDYSEAAKILNVPLGTVKSRLARARLQMAQKLKEAPECGRYLTDTNASLAS